MRIGVTFPQTELGGDVGAVRAYGQRVEELGFTHILAYDHVLGADPEVHQGWAGSTGPAATGAARPATSEPVGWPRTWRHWKQPLPTFPGKPGRY